MGTARTFIGLVAFIGLMAVLRPLAGTDEVLSARFLCYFLLAMLSSGLKVSLPGVTGTLSVSFLFILASMAELGPLQTMAIGNPRSGPRNRRLPNVQSSNPAK